MSTNKSNLATISHHPSAIVDRRVTCVFLFSATYCNHQGGAEVDNTPRVDPDTGCAWMSTPGITRKLRDTLESDGHAIFVSRGVELDAVYRTECAKFGIHAVAESDSEPAATESDSETSEELDSETSEEPKKVSKGKNKGKNAKKTTTFEERQARSDNKKNVLQHMCQTYLDIKFFGQVLTNPEPMAVTGPVRISWAWTEHPVNTISYAVTRVAGIGKERGMGHSTVIRYGLFRCYISIDPVQAKRTGFTWGDLEILKNTLYVMFERTSSATRSQMVAEKMVWFTHTGSESGLGSVPNHKLHRRVKSVLKDPSKPPTSTDDYEIRVDLDGLPDTIEVQIID